MYTFILQRNRVWNLKTVLGIQIEIGWNKILDRIGDDRYNLSPNVVIDKEKLFSVYSYTHRTSS